MKRLRFGAMLLLAAGVAFAGATPASGQPADGKKPNILCIWGDDIGTWNISHNNRGMMGYKTPNIDRIAKEGVAFTDLLRAAELPGGSRGVHQRLAAGALRHDQGRHARRSGRLAEVGRDDGHADEKPGLRHGSIREKPSGRPR